MTQRALHKGESAPAALTEAPVPDKSIAPMVRAPASQPRSSKPDRLVRRFVWTSTFFALSLGCSDAATPDGQPASAVDGGGASDAGTLGPCFQRHLEEAIAVNEERRPKYAALTDGRSDPISETLIESEKTSLLFAKQVDEAAVPFHEAGVPIVCDEFISMSEVPAFQEDFGFDPEPLTSFEPVDGGALAKELEAAFAEGGFAALSAACDAWLTQLHEPRAYHCMLRHMLESLRRIGNVAPTQHQRAQQAGLDGALDLSEDMVRLHLLSLSAAAKLDEQAAPLQAEGVPILCRDVPAIPPHL